MRNNYVRRIVLTALIAAIVFVATYFSQYIFPVSLLFPGSTGYFNIGDIIIIACALAIGEKYIWLAGGLGSAISDILLGWAIYSPFTFVIKSLEGLVIWLIAKAVKRMAKGKWVVLIAAAIAGSAIMISGYFLTDWLIYGLNTAIANTLMNCIQGAAGTAGGYMLGMILRVKSIQRAINWKSA